MERSEILSTMSILKLYGMKAAYDEILATAIKRQHEPERVVGDLLAAEIAEKQARSIKYQMTLARLPLAKDLKDFVFDGGPVNETLVHDLAGGNFLAHQRNCVLVGGTGTGKTHLAIAIARACIRNGARPVLQGGRPRQQARERGSGGAPGPHRRPARPPGLGRPR
jgi:DNA replication protein DnaC